MKTTAEHAKSYHSLGWGVLQVYAPHEQGCTCAKGAQCTSPGKHPYGGTNAILTSDQIECIDWEQCNVGLTPGANPAFFVVDVDNKGDKNGGATLQQWVKQHGPLPRSPAVQTGSGLHLYFKHPDQAIPNSVEGLGPGVDIRAKGGFVVAPPSSHVSGTEYKWIVPPTVPLPDAPDWLLGLLKPKEKPPGTSFFDSPMVKAALREGIQLELKAKMKRARQYLSNVPPAIEGQGGDEQTFRAASVIYSFGLTQAEGWDLLLEYNQRCVPPWDEEGLRTKMNSAYTNTDAAHPFGWRLAKDAAEAEEARQSGAIVLDSHKDMTLANWVVDSFGGKEVFQACVDRFYHYEGGIWVDTPAGAVRGRAHKLHDALVLSEDGGSTGRVNMTAHKTKALENLIKDMPDVQNPDFLTTTVPGAAFINGFLDGVSLEFVEHSPDNRAFDLFEFDFYGDTDPWVSFVSSLFKGDPDADDKINLLRQFYGACILGIAPQYQRCLMLTGGGSNGKSTFMEIFEGLFPLGARTSIAPQQWNQPYFAAQLQGAKLNTVNEIEEKVFASDIFKQIISGETTTARHPYERPVQFRPTSGHIFSANSLPATMDQSRGFWRRFAVVPFNREFEKNPETKDAVVRQFTQQRGAIAQWAVEGAKVLIEKGGYHLPESHHQAIGEWRTTADAVTDFVKSCTRPGRGLLKSLYHYFKIWAEAEGRGRLGKQQFAKRLAQVSGVERLQRNTEGCTFSVEMKTSKEWADYSGPTMMERFRG